MDIFPLFFLVSSITIYSSSFSNYLKLANITPVHKKDSRNDKRNYRPVSVISYVLQVFENIWNQKSLYTLRIFLANSKLLFFRQGFNAQLCLLVMLKKLRKVLDEGGSYVALLTDLSKAFDCIAHNLTLLNFNYTASICHH